MGELIDKLAVVLETCQGALVAGIIEMAHEQTTGFGVKKPSKIGLCTPLVTHS